VQGKYDSHVKPRFNEIFDWYKEGHSLQWIGAQLGVSKESIFKYKREHSDLADLVKKAEKSKIKAIGKAAHLGLIDKLHDRYIEDAEVIDEVWTAGSDKNHQKIVKQHKVRKKRWVPADTTAIIFALKNADPDNWKDRRDTNIAGEIKTSSQNPYADLTTEELRKLIDSASDGDG
jgi:frataxin-like iron-binding protein CyaY